MLVGSNVYLRAVEKSDATSIYMWENNPENWKVSNTEVPFSMFDIMALIEHQADLRKSGQLRLVILEKEHERAVGVIDLYEVNFKHGYASVGILIAMDADRGKGFASEALQLLIGYTRDYLELRNLQCSIHGDNEASIALFERMNFRKIGVRKGWLKYKGKEIDELSFQLCLKENT
jgi:diamine N-acetyltransferase